jgi:hypothetical protein
VDIGTNSDTGIFCMQYGGIAPMLTLTMTTMDSRAGSWIRLSGCLSLLIRFCYFPPFAYVFHFFHRRERHLQRPSCRKAHPIRFFQKIAFDVLKRVGFGCGGLTIEFDHTGKAGFLLQCCVMYMLGNSRSNSLDIAMSAVEGPFKATTLWSWLVDCGVVVVSRSRRLEATCMLFMKIFLRDGSFAVSKMITNDNVVLHLCVVTVLSMGYG